MSPAEFAQKWMGSTRTERAASQEHFIDLCRMLGVPTPNEADPIGDIYAFEKGAGKIEGGDGFADVWKRGHFAWEYKGKRKNLDTAYTQLLQYREALDNPPLLVVCDLDRFRVHTNFTNTPTVVYEFALADLLSDPQEPLRILRALMESPEELRPGKTRDEITAEAAEQFASLAERLRGRGHDPHEVAHFLNKLLFCMFAEDASLLPPGLLRRLVEASQTDPAIFIEGLAELFTKMSDKGGLFGAERIQWFNGGLFDGGQVLPLTAEEIKTIDQVSHLDWSQVEPAIFGTLFERGLDPSKRSQLGAHYTDRGSIMRLIEPVLMTPLRRDFEQTKEQVEALLAQGKKVTARTPAAQNPEAVFNAFLKRLRAVRVLDPACGSGNFLYLALQALKDLEREAVIWASDTIGKGMQLPEIGPEAVLGIELNSYAAELARVVIWIGHIQWMLSNGFAYARDPILRPLDNIECRDAVLDLSDPVHPREPEWPEATVIVGNPPFLGSRFLRANLGDEYVDAMFSVYDGRVLRGSDLVCYWHEKARAMLEAGRVERVGLLATQSIRGGENRTTLERINSSGNIFAAWSDEPWVLDGAAVHVSFLAYDGGEETERMLDGRLVKSINTNLTAGLDLTRARRLRENLGIAFMGDTKGGAFDIPGEMARNMLASANPDGRQNSDVVRPWINGLDVTRRPRGMWIIDFGTDVPIEEAALYEAPFEYVKQHVEPVRKASRTTTAAWWLHERPRPEMRTALGKLERFIATPTTAKHRLFVWVGRETLPHNALIAFARDDDYFFGVLQSSVHELWALSQGTQLETRPRYTPTTTFETFPFPECDDETKEQIARAARSLDERRNGWLNPPGLSDAELKKRTLTNLYNQRPAWLEQAHERLDRMVYAAYGWEYPLEPEEVLVRLMELNLRCTSESGGG
ncbi:MAG: class I SAM-dependent DNA methyltransferase [Actinobacteria bacterium]|nr:class I SAM-dependent DNA methyltransferase [Actinomycetota bacterium]